MRRAFLVFPLLILSLLIGVNQSFAQKPEVGDKDREFGKKMLATTMKELTSKYYDKSLHGMDVEERFKIAEGRIDKAITIGEIYGIVAQVVLELNDSHTFLIPPPRQSVSYGWDMQIIGEVCMVTYVEPRSDAEKKGLKVGDEIHSVDGVLVTRDNISQFTYLYHILRPKKRIRVVVQHNTGQRQEVEIESRAGFLGQRLDRSALVQTHEIGKDLLIVRLLSLSIPPEDIDKFVKKARKFKSMIIDLRHNGGGLEVTMQRLIGHFFDKDIKIATVKWRDATTEVMAKTRGKDVFTGQLVVLVDSDSASAAEVFARVIQLEKRGMVLGDRTSGRVMRSVRLTYKAGDDKFVVYGLSITVSDLIMTDGKSLEHKGMTPDELILPTGADMLNKRDPVLARAAQILGGTLDAAAAGSLFK
ncbi:MAG TPA: S41 family peptidase [Blastocatellia bacterium]|nr:S41 family peptidase [Blastocatellia bacterium]